VDILGVRQNYYRRPVWGSENTVTDAEVMTIARSLPTSVKNLNFIGVGLPHSESLSCLKYFSEKGRESLPEPAENYMHSNPIEVNVQNLTLHYSFLSSGYTYIHAPPPFYDFTSIQQAYESFAVSVVDEASRPSTDSSIPLVSFAAYINYMSKKEGVCLSHMDSRVMKPNEHIEAIIDSAVREYSYFEPLLNLPEKNNLYQLAPYTELHPTFICSLSADALFQALKLLEDPCRMKYDTLMGIDRVFETKFEGGSPSTYLSQLISTCNNDASFSFLQKIIEEFKPKLTVNGARNYLVDCLLNITGDTSKMQVAAYLVSKNPDLVVLGNTEGIINNDEKNLPLIQFYLSRPRAIECLEEFKHLIELGASVTNVNQFGDNVLHAACKTLNIDFVSYLLSVCPGDAIYAGNNKNETPIEKVFALDTLYPHHCLAQNSTEPQVLFLEQATKLPCFNESSSLRDYRTSCGNLLHAATMSPRLPTIQWLLEKGFDANSLNEKGENSLFYSRSSKEEPRAFTRGYPFSRFERRHLGLLTQDKFINDIDQVLITAGAKIDVISNDGNSVITNAIIHNNYELINYFILNPSISSTPLHELLSPRMEHGNALHYLFKMLSDMTSEVSVMNKKQKIFNYGRYPVVRHCALLCLEHYPEMLHERSEEAKGVFSSRSPLQILLEASKGLQLLNDLSIKLSDIANKPIFKSKDSNVVAPIPIMYLALEVEIDIPLFDKLMACTENVMVRDDSQDTKPNLLHIAAERDAMLCRCIIKHWKKKFKTKKELEKYISMPLENDSANGQKPRNAAMIACGLDLYEIFSVLWPHTKLYAEQFDPIQVALDNNYNDFAFSAVLSLGIVPTKHQLHEIVRWGLTHGELNTSNEAKVRSLMTKAEKEQPDPSWFELVTQQMEHKGEEEGTKSLTTLQLFVCKSCSNILDWFIQSYKDDSRSDARLKAVDVTTGNSLLLFSISESSQTKLIGDQLLQILFSIVHLFRTEPQTKRTKRSNNNLNNLNQKELTEYLNIQNRAGRTCLHYAALHDKIDIVQELLKLGASPDIKDSEGKLAMELATSVKSRNTIQSYLDERDGKETPKRKMIDKQFDNEDEDHGSRRSKRRRTTRLISLVNSDWV